MVIKLFRDFLGRSAEPVKPRLDRHFHLPVDEMTVAQLHDVLAPLVEANPALQAFETVNELMWVDNSRPPVRPVLAFQKMKGGVLWPMYGLSIDFVPVVAGKRAVMRKGQKSAKFDIRIDPRDHLFDISFMWGAAAALQDIKQTLPVVLERALPFWLQHQTVFSLSDAIRFEEAHTTAIPGLGIENYVQAGFARPYLLAATGHTERATELWKVQMDSSALDEIGKKKANSQFEQIMRGGRMSG